MKTRNHAEEVAAVEWFEIALGLEPRSLVTGEITSCFPERRYWFAGINVLCHAGNLRRPYWYTDTVVGVEPVAAPKVNLHDRIVYTPSQGPKGHRAYTWYMLSDIMTLYLESEEDE